jgi:hypothetical protein
MSEIFEAILTTLGIVAFGGVSLAIATGFVNLIAREYRDREYYINGVYFFRRERSA